MRTMNLLTTEFFEQIPEFHRITRAGPIEEGPIYSTHVRMPKPGRPYMREIYIAKRADGIYTMIGIWATVDSDDVYVEEKEISKEQYTSLNMDTRKSSVMNFYEVEMVFDNYDVGEYEGREFYTR